MQLTTPVNNFTNRPRQNASSYLWIWQSDL